MTPRTLVVASAVAFMMLAGSRPAQAQEPYEFKVPFTFVANGHAFAAGSYDITPSDIPGALILRSRSPKGGEVLLPVESRVSEPSSLAQPEIVFDKLNGKLYVSELLVPGDDGYMVQAAKGDHEHEVLKGASVKE
jgi:hypothetical protein